MLTFIKPFSKCEVTVFNQPFVYGYIDDFIPADIYAQLEASFLDPTKSENMQVFKHGKNRTVFVAPPAPLEIPADSPWMELIKQITSATYMEDCLQWIQKRYAESKPDLDNLYTKMMMSRFDIDKNELKMQCEFSTLENSTYLESHTDAENKFMSCILYLAQPEWQDSWGGATEVYRAKNSTYADNWDNRHLPNEQMELIANCHFRPNRLFFFVKSQDSWHGLSPIVSPPGVQRRTFNFSMMASHAAFDKTPISLYQRQISKHEAKVFKDGTLKRIFRKLSILLKG